MSLQLYHASLSAPARVVRILIKLLGLDVELKEIDLLAGEHLKPQFTSINPFHVIPTLVDGDFALWESRVIMTYLVDKYAPGNSLYPSDLKTRSTIDRWLYWDVGTLFVTFANYYRPVYRGQKPDPAFAELFKTKVKDLDSSLEKTKYVTGNSLTIVDISISITLTVASAIGIDLSEFKNVDRWLKQIEADLTPSVWSNLATGPSNTYGEWFKSRLSK